jgi:hypothetical protein
VHESILMCGVGLSIVGNINLGCNKFLKSVAYN